MFYRSDQRGSLTRGSGGGDSYALRGSIFDLRATADETVDVGMNWE